MNDSTETFNTDNAAVAAADEFAYHHTTFILLLKLHFSK